MGVKDLALFSPLPPSRTGIADYSVELGRALRETWDVVYVIGDDAPKPRKVPEGTRYFRVTDWNMGESRDVPRFYQMGNNVHHEFIFYELLKKCGVTLLHDFSLHHLLVELTIARGDSNSYVRLLEREHGMAGRRVGELRCNHYIHHEIMEFLLPINHDVIANSKGVVVHSSDALKRIGESHPGVLRRQVPFPFEPPDDSMLTGNRMKARRELDIDEDAFVIVSLGFVTPPKQCELVLRALADCAPDLPKFEYLLVGEVSEVVSIADLVTRLGLSGKVRATGFVEFSTFHHYIEAADLVVSLRYPTAGETSAALLRAMGLARANIVFDYASYSDLPDHAVIKIPLNTRDPDNLARAIVKAANGTEYREGVAQSAADHVRKYHDISDVARKMGKFIVDCYNN